MNQFFYEHEASEKLRQLRNEGLRSQEFRRSRVRGQASRAALPRIAAVALGLLTIILIWAL